MLSVQTPNLPPVEACRLRSQALAMLDAIVSPDWEFRYYSFNQHWAAGEQMASMRDGSGDEYFLLFTGGGCVYKVFEHEKTSPEDSAATLAHAKAHLPSEYQHFLTEPAFQLDAASRIGWFDLAGDVWKEVSNAKPTEVFALLTGQPNDYVHWAKEYYELDLDLSAVEAVYDHAPLTAEMIEGLQGELTLADLAADGEEIGYPLAE